MHDSATNKRHVSKKAELCPSNTKDLSGPLSSSLIIDMEIFAHDIVASK